MSTTLVVPAPKQTRWYEMQIAGMVGQVIDLDNVAMKVVFAGPVDGTPAEGASRMELILEAIVAR